MVRLILPQRRTTLVALALLGRHANASLSLSTKPSAAFVTFHSRHQSLRASSTSVSMSKRVLVPIGDGSEEIETTCLTDTLTRCGAEVVVASVMPDLVCKMSRGIKVMADVSIADAAKESWDLVVLPGGMPGAEHLRDCEPLISLLEDQKKDGKMYGAVCAAPAVVLASKGLIEDGSTCYPAPGFREKLTDPKDDEVVVTGNLTTSQGPGTSIKFALMLGEQLFSKEKADEVAAAMLVKR